MSVVSQILTNVSLSDFHTGQGVATDEPQLVTGENLASLTRGVFMHNLGPCPLYIGGESVSESSGFVLKDGASHLFPVEASGRLWVIGRGTMYPPHGEDAPYFGHNQFTWYAL